MTNRPTAYEHPHHVAKVRRNERANAEGYRPHDTDKAPTPEEIAAVEAEQSGQQELDFASTLALDKQESTRRAGGVGSPTLYQRRY